MDSRYRKEAARIISGEFHLSTLDSFNPSIADALRDSNSLVNPQVSILLPFRDSAATVRQALRSMVAQSFTKWELLAIDDGSHDDGPEFVETLARSDERIRLLKMPRCGLVAALNRGLEEAQASLIARMDADDWSHPQRLERQVAWLQARRSLDLVSCRVEPGAGMGLGYRRYVQWINAIQTVEEHRHRRFAEAPVAHPSVVFRRRWIEVAGPYRDGNFPEDYDLWLRGLEAGLTMEKVPDTLLVWNDPPGRLSRTDPRYAVEAFYSLKNGYLSRWLKSGIAPKRPVWLWGAGRITRRRFDALLEEVCLAGFIDVDSRKTGRVVNGLPVISPESLEPEAFILIAVASHGAREKIMSYLERQGRREGQDYLCAA